MKAPTARSSVAAAWTAGTHYHIGKVVRPTIPDGRVYRMIAFAGGPSYPLDRVSGAVEPAWNPAIGQTTPDNHLIWQTLHDLDDPANAGAIEPLPQRAEAQPDSAAVDLAGLLADFNSLLAKMRAANLLAP